MLTLSGADKRVTELEMAALQPLLDAAHLVADRMEELLSFDDGIAYLTLLAVEAGQVLSGDDTALALALLADQDRLARLNDLVEGDAILQRLMAQAEASDGK